MATAHLPVLNVTSDLISLGHAALWAAPNKFRPYSYFCSTEPLQSGAPGPKDIVLEFRHSWGVHPEKTKIGNSLGDWRDSEKFKVLTLQMADSSSILESKYDFLRAARNGPWAQNQE